MLDCCLSLEDWSEKTSDWALVGVGTLKEAYLGEGVGKGLNSSGTMVAHTPCPTASEETGDGTGLHESREGGGGGGGGEGGGGGGGSSKGGGRGWSTLIAPVTEKTGGCLGWSW